MASSGNFCTLNPLAKSPNATVTQGNLYLPSVGYPSNVLGTMGVSSGKWYFEARCENNYGAYDSFGVIVSDNYTYKDQVTSSITGSINWTQLSEVRINGTNEGVTNTQYYNGDTKIVGCALDLDNNKVWFHGNGTYVYDSSESSANPSTNTGGYAIPSVMQGKHFLPLLGTNAVGAPAIRRANFGQDSSFGGDATAQNNADDNGNGDFYYSPPTGFLALCSANLPISSDIDPAGDDGATENPTKQFNAITYTGNGSTNAITGLGFQPDLVWIKRRNSSATYSNGLVDSSRGRSKVLISNLTNSEWTSSSTQDVVSFDSDGFTLGTNNNIACNASSNTFISWGWKANGGTTSSNSNGSITSSVQANTKAGFSIATYTSPNSSSNQTVGHGLSGVDFVITKNRDATFNWYCFHSASSGKTYRLNSGSEHSYSNWSMGATTWGSENGYTHDGTSKFVAYCWQNVAGMQHFGSYTGNGNTDGPFVYTGFRPSIIFTLLTNSTSGWRVRDTARDTFNPSDTIVWWSLEGQEYSNSGYNFDILSNGFKIRTSGSDFNTSGSKYLFGAWGNPAFRYNNIF